MKLDSSAFVADPELIHALEEKSTPVSCGEERVIFQQGDLPEGLYILDQGKITLTMTSPGGKEVMQMEAQQGSLLGLPGLIGQGPYTLSAIAHDGARLSFVPRDQFTGLMQADAQLSFKILQILAAELRSARQALSTR
ncbi:MAG: cyclic nucleotide-binding domain-containing protein [Terracidiphilus sp.]|jgi:CRP/FNR family transcriptional regulator